MHAYIHICMHTYFILSPAHTYIDEFANSIDPDEMAHADTSHRKKKLVKQTILSHVIGKNIRF